MRTPLWLSLAAAAAGPPGDEAVDVRRYDLEVVVLPETLRERIRIEAVAREALATWALDLVRPMEVRSASVNGKPAGLERKGDTVVLDMAGAGVGELSVELSVEGRPQERFSEDRGGFVRSDVTPDLAYVRSQVPWYPRAPDDAAAWRAVVETPIGWIARTAGREAGREEAADRVRWTFEEPRPFESAGLVAGPYRRVEGKAAGGAALDALVFPEDEKGAGPLLETARRALDHYGARFGSVEARRFTLVEMPATFGKGSGYGEAGYVLLGKGAFEEGGAAAWADALVAHEVAHTWWGREVGFTTFASESLASYSTLGFLEAERGAGAARAERQRAVTAIAKAASEGKTAALAEIRPWGRGMDPETYRVHAYEKAMMLLVMAEDALGRPAMDRSLAGFFARNRGSRVDWPELREALGAAGPAARVVLEQGEGPGVPILTVSHEARKSGGGWEVEGTLTQEGTPKPWRLRVKLSARCGEKRAEETVKIEGPSVRFRLSLPAPLGALVADPDFRLLAARRVPGAPDPKEVVDRCFRVVNDPKAADPKVLATVLADLRGLLDSGAGEMEPLCHTGIGRCLFRQGKLVEAKQELERALDGGAGGPFHRSWCHLRLGCIADLQGRRKDALASYEKARGPGASKPAAEMAGRFLEKPYRGYDKDG